MQTVSLAGNVGKDAKLNSGRDGEKVLNFSLAIDNGKDKDATWWDCALWGKRAESLERYVTKGSKIAVSGRPSVRVHEGKAYLGVTVDQITLQGGGERRDSHHSDDRPSGGAKPSQSGGPGSYQPGGRDDDIPFEMPWR